MRFLIVFVVFFSVTALMTAKVSLEIYESDGITPFNYRNIAVGTELKLVVSSDANDIWSGGIFLQGDDRNLGLLRGHGWDPNTHDWTGCHFTGAGSEPYVFSWEDSYIQGFDLFTSPEGDSSASAWFTIDYIALEPSEPNIAFYEHNISWDDPNAFVYLSQVPTADYNTDGIVNFLDFSFLSSCWMQENGADPNNCINADLDKNGLVDVNDLLLFSEYWLWPVSNTSSSDPNQEQPELDPNLIYRVVDANGLSEIMMSIEESIILYVDMETIDVNEVWTFEVEVTLSDPNLGSIDNTAYDPNDPPGPGTARILADPNRWEIFDRWGPGNQQPEGIFLSGASQSGAFEDGHLASFVYTCQAAGEVVLDLINWDTTTTSGEKRNPILESIMIHQDDMLSGETAMSSMSLEAAAPAEETSPSMSQEEVIQSLNDIWETDPEIQNTIDEKDWKKFMKSVEQSY